MITMLSYRQYHNLIYARVEADITILPTAQVKHNSIDAKLFTKVNFYIRKCNIIINHTLLVLVGLIDKLHKGTRFSRHFSRRHRNCLTESTATQSSPHRESNSGLCD